MVSDGCISSGNSLLFAFLSSFPCALKNALQALAQGEYILGDVHKIHILQSFNQTDEGPPHKNNDEHGHGDALELVHVVCAIYDECFTERRFLRGWPSGWDGWRDLKSTGGDRVIELVSIWAALRDDAAILGDGQERFAQ